MQFSVLTFIESLLPPDLGWIDSNANILTLQPQDVLMEEGAHNSDLYIVESGLLLVYTSDSNNTDICHDIAKIGPGSLIGDLSWLDSHETSASVKALEKSLVLRINGDSLQKKIATDSEFAARFLHGIARILAQRLRDTNNTLTRFAANAARVATESQTANLLLIRLEAFKARLLNLDRHLIALPTQSVETSIAELQPAFHGLMVEFNTFIATERAAHIRAEVGAIFQRELLPYIAMTEVAEHLYAKPRGYAGDYHAIELMYRNRGSGHGRLGPLVDQCFLEEPAAQAIRNRRRLIAAEIQAQITPERNLNVTGLACGSAKEILDLFSRDRNTRIQYTGIDFDNEALEHVIQWAETCQVEERVKIVHGNLVHIATGRQAFNLPPQDFIYGIGLIDYFGDQFAIKLLDWMYSQLAPGGRVLLGNFHPSNPDKAMMSLILDWPLYHRSEEDMHRLFAASEFGRDCDRILFDETGIILFAEGIKH